MKPITDYRHFDYDPPAWRTNQRATPPERQPGAPLLLMAFLGVFSGAVMVVWALYQYSGWLGWWAVGR